MRWVILDVYCKVGVRPEVNNEPIGSDISCISIVVGNNLAIPKVIV